MQLLLLLMIIICDSYSLIICFYKTVGEGFSVLHKDTKAGQKAVCLSRQLPCFT